jgi:hypothetical protein
MNINAAPQIAESRTSIPKWRRLTGLSTSERRLPFRDKAPERNVTHLSPLGAWH